MRGWERGNHGQVIKCRWIEWPIRVEEGELIGSDEFTFSVVLFDFRGYREFNWIPSFTLLYISIMHVLLSLHCNYSCSMCTAVGLSDVQIIQTGTCWVVCWCLKCKHICTLCIVAKSNGKLFFVKYVKTMCKLRNAQDGKRTTIPDRSVFTCLDHVCVCT